MYLGTNYNLVEKNSFLNNGLSAGSNPRKVSRTQAPWNPPALQCHKNCNNMIIRKNIFAINNSVLGYYGENMHYYHNTSYKQIRTVYGDGGDYDVRYNNYKNNIFANTESLGRKDDETYVSSWYTYVQPGHIMESNAITHNTFTGDNKNFRYYKNYHLSSLENFEDSVADAYQNNTLAPQFIDADKQNFNLLPNSDLIDGGDWLTIIISSNTKDNNSFIVEKNSWLFL